VTGAAKRGAIQRISLAQRFDPALPITGIQPIRDESQLTWYLDDEAVRSQAE
jgi:6-phosphogluconolactonase/glucosamine-6-phosphate isomerase/deaminase